MSRSVARVFANWRTGLSGPVIVRQAGTAVNYFGPGLILPFEIIYLHEVRGFTTATAGLVLAAVMGTAAVATLPAGALLDRFRAKPILITSNLVRALGCAGLAFVERPWQGFVCSAVGGTGFAVAGSANQLLSLTLVTPEQRAASIALRRVAGNFGMGAGATVAGFIVASAAGAHVSRRRPGWAGHDDQPDSTERTAGDQQDRLLQRRRRLRRRLRRRRGPRRAA